MHIWAKREIKFSPFEHSQIDDQICLLINSWCELLLFSCCFRSISTPGEVRISLGKSINLEQAKFSGLQVGFTITQILTKQLLIKYLKYNFITFLGMYRKNVKFNRSFETIAC